MTCGPSLRPSAFAPFALRLTVGNIVFPSEPELFHGIIRARFFGPSISRQHPAHVPT